MSDVTAAGARLLRAWDSPSGEADTPAFDEEPYAIQDTVLERRVLRGETVVGVAVDADLPSTGWLTNAMRLEGRDALSLDRLSDPQVTPHLAFVLDDSLDGGAVSAPDVISATSAVYAAFLITDNHFRPAVPTAADTIADNSGAAYFHLGARPRRPVDVDLSLLGVLLELAGDVVDTGAGAAAMGNPAAAVAWAAREVHRRGHALSAGMVVLSGALTAPVPVTIDSHVSATFAHLGRVSLPLRA